MIAIGLNLILGMLLICALILGLRLERKLRGLRDSHADFAKAVSELDQAAGRTENSLATLRAGTETARNEVASRIDQARIACQRLEKLVADADKAADRPGRPAAGAARSRLAPASAGRPAAAGGGARALRHRAARARVHVGGRPDGGPPELRPPMAGRPARARG